MLGNLAGFATTKPPLKTMRCANVAAQVAQLPQLPPVTLRADGQLPCLSTTRPRRDTEPSGHDAAPCPQHLAQDDARPHLETGDVKKKELVSLTGQQPDVLAGGLANSRLQCVGWFKTLQRRVGKPGERARKRPPFHRPCHRTPRRVVPRVVDTPGGRFNWKARLPFGSHLPQKLRGGLGALCGGGLLH